MHKETPNFYPLTTQNLRTNDYRKSKILSYKKIDDQKRKSMSIQKAIEISNLINEEK